ncbi:hypothetical protein FRACYDRAFT_250718 [Fragilariopsis cylindrus CCMP1102]|uniref:Helicase-associated domain-containing protein n=1 Tax=Fragilariopsis cylindrus CCMP1102 TaxID=635003 RepID=A0A1E7EPJ2_9STRA|nr:hypothetical protein FRACYDRAFT_250718 [Fragilariopsis cylindrus CCMP1102]|eukprot:OEU07696.1 hypothetical protein FRACYDRAFT_250718 [Fragilariopsis cylindrus CCMP1102]
MSSHHVAAASSDSATIKKEEEEEEEEDSVQNNHGANVNMNHCDLNNRLVKKEEEEEEEGDSKKKDNDDCFEDWKVGNYSSHNTSSINNEDTAPKKKKKARSLPPPNPHKQEEDNEVNNKRNSDDGYESWTEGNWCWLLPTNKRRKQPPIRVENRSSYTSSSQNSMCVDVDPDPDKSNELEKNNLIMTKTKTTTTTTTEEILSHTQRGEVNNGMRCSTDFSDTKETDNQLGKWMNNQRQSYKRENLSVNRIERLELTGFVWDTFEEQWMVMYDRLVMYKKKHKSTLVPSCYNGDNQLPYLGYWAVNQRVYYRDGKLLKKRVELLNSISFKWEVK